MTLKQFNRIIELRTKIISMGTFLSGTIYSLVLLNEFSYTRFFLMMTAVLCVDMGTTGFNSYFDFKNGTDKASLNYEKDKVLVHEGVSPLLALLISLSLFMMAGVLGLILGYLTHFYLIIVGALCMAVGFIYTGGPYPISRTPFGELFAGGFLGPVLFLISFYVQSLTLTWMSVIVSFPLLLLVGMILTINNTCDKESDLEAGRKTLSIVLSEKANNKLIFIEFYGAYIYAIVLGFSPILPIYVSFTLSVALLFGHREFRKMKEEGFSLHTKGTSIGHVSKLFLFYVIAFCVGIILSLLF
ncbi:MAG: prenyltransferase [Spirochaetia bacterium]|nr:prenyltransferase [Spirochaetia bacterium]